MPNWFCQPKLLGLFYIFLILNFYTVNMVSIYFFNPLCSLDTLLAALELAKDLGKLGNGADSRQVLDGSRYLGAHLGIHKEAGGEEEGRGDLEIGQRQLLADEELLTALDGGLDLAEGTLERGGAVVILPLAEGDGLDHHQQWGGGVGDELGLGEQGPLGDLALGLGVGTQELGLLGAGGGEVGGDSGTLGDSVTVGTLKGGDLAQGEVGQELGGLVGDAHLEVWELKLKAVQLSNNLGLKIV